MKHRLILLFFLPLLVTAQTYPFREGFEGLVSSQPPPGWGGDMKVMLDHGLYDSKGLAARVSSAVLVDSSITPLIGPLTSSSYLSFFYRIVDYAFYPNTETYLDSGDRVEILISTDTVNYQVIYLIDMDTHNPTTNFVKKKVFVTQYAVSVVNFKIRCTFGHGAGYYVDFDTVVVANDAQLGIEDINNQGYVSLYPNPCSSLTNLEFPILSSTEQEVTVFNSLGEKMFERKTVSGFQLPTSNFPNGIYYVQAGDETKKVTRKLVVQH